MVVKKIFVSFLISISFFIFASSSVLADHRTGGQECDPSQPNGHCVDGYSCQRSQAKPSKYLCQNAPFGQIQAPDPLKDFISKDPTGAFGISQFLSNLIALFFSVATIVLIFMLIWGAFDWLTSEGDKEKIDSARKKIISAITGMILFAIAFAVIKVLGTFTGFKFFAGQ